MALVLASLVASPAQAALPPSLAGEVFPNGQTVAPATECPEPATLTYTATGTATGPYPGPYTETGTVTGSDDARQVLTWTASFTIDSPQGQVTGEKTLSASVDFRCVTAIPDALRHADADLTYTATIKTAAGTVVDQGHATAHLVVNSICNFRPGGGFGDCDGVDEVRNFTESFISSTGVLPTNGKATGGGQLASGVTFGFNAEKTAAGRLQGNCNVVDQATRTQVKCLTVTSYVQIGNTATWQGTATVNGVQRPYTITVQDNGEPNRGNDTFSITAGTYQASGNVKNGNIQVHKQ